MKKMTIAVLGVLLAGCSASVIVKKAPEHGKNTRIAVLPFKAHPANPASGELAYEAFSTHILRLKGYDIVDRGALEQILKEQKFSQSGTIDQQQAVEIGKLLGAQGVVLGSVTEYVNRKHMLFPPAKISLTARLINTETGEVEWTGSKTAGGPTRWFTWIVWPVGIYATIASPSAEDQVNRAARLIVRALEKEFEKK